MICIECKHASGDRPVICSAPQIAGLAVMVIGEPSPDAKMDASDARLNPALCGAHAQWFEAKDAPPAEPVPDAAPEPAPAETPVAEEPADG
jgi:hypothetical protein